MKTYCENSVKNLAKHDTLPMFVMPNVNELVTKSDDFVINRNKKAGCSGSESSLCSGFGRLATHQGKSALLFLYITQPHSSRKMPNVRKEECQGNNSTHTPHIKSTRKHRDYKSLFLSEMRHKNVAYAYIMSKGQYEDFAGFVLEHPGEDFHDLAAYHFITSELS